MLGLRFNVYNIGWYVDAAAAQNDPIFSSYKSMSYEELRKNETFLSLMYQTSRFDRSLLIKLAMTLKRDMVIKALVEELKIDRKFSVSLLNARIIDGLLIISHCV
jgi:hypothetical protein